MADKRISQLIERVDIANNDVLPIVASGATTTNKVTISTIQDWMQSNLDVGVTSVGLTMPSAFQVSGSPITTSGNITVTAAGTASQYIRGDGTLADFPQGGGGGGASVSYYLNGSVSQGTIGGVAYLEMNKTPVLGAGTDFNISADGYIASFITDAGDPALLEIPAGNWNFETYFQASSAGGTPSFYVELYKVSGATATLIASNSVNPELIAFGTSTTPYFSALAVPQTTLALTDRLAIRIYVVVSGRTITLHTENSNLCQVITTFTTGLTALNGLTAQVQNFATGTSGTDFNISSSGSIHTFNLPDASASARGVVTTGSQVFGGVKTFANGLSLPSVGGTNQASRFVNIGTIHQGSGGSNQIGFNNSNNIYFGKGLDNGGVIQWNNSAVRYYTLPNADGTLALTSDLGAYLPLTGGTLTGALNGTNATFTAAGSTFVSTITTGGSDMRISSGASAGNVGTFSNHPLSFVVNNSVVATIAVGGAATFSSSVSAGQLFLSTPSNLVATINSTNPSGCLLTWQTNGTIIGDIGTAQMLFGTGGADTFGISGRGARSLILGTNNTPRLTIDSTGAATFSGVLNGTTASFNNLVNITASGGGAAINVRGRSVDDLGQILFFDNNGSTLRNIIQSQPSSLAIYSQGNTPITFGTNNAGGGGTRMTIGGDGTITLAGALSGTSASFSGDVITSSSQANINLNSTSTSQFSRLAFEENGTRQAGIQFINSAFATTSRRSKLEIFGGGGIHFVAQGNFNSPDFTIASTGAATFSSSVTATRLSLNNSGTSARLQINGVNSEPIAYLYNNSGTAGSVLGVSIEAGTNSSDYALSVASSLGSPYLRVRGDGNVGIGTASPSAKLHIDSPTSGGSGEEMLRITRNTAGQGIRLMNYDGGTGIDGFTLKTLGNTNLLHFRMDGNIGIGTATPTKRLQVEASVAGEVANIKNTRNNTSGDYSLVTELGSNCNNTNNYHYIAVTGVADRLYIYGNGNVVNTNNSYGSLSDAKIKENIEDATPKLDDLMKVKVRNYNLIGDDKKQIGVIAQELEEVFPAMIDESEDFEDVEVPQLDEEGNEILNEEGEVVTEKQRISKGTTTKSVKYSVFVPMLIKAMQEQQEQIKSLTEQVEALKSQING